MDIRDRAILNILDYMDWEEKFDYDGWYNNIEIYLSDTLSKAWLDARSDDYCKFEDEQFKDMVDNANGKWLEKQSPTDSYKVLLSTKYNNSIDALSETLVYELRLCMDYQNAVCGLEFDDYCPGDCYFNNWSEFRATVCSTRYSFYSAMRGDFSDFDECFTRLAEIYGRLSADCFEGILNSEPAPNTMYYLSRYIGVSHAIHDLNIEIGLNSKALHLWTMSPTTIIGKYGNVFNLGNEWNEKVNCSLNEKPGAYYNKIVNYLYS